MTNLIVINGFVNRWLQTSSRALLRSKPCGLVRWMGVRCKGKRMGWRAKHGVTGCRSPYGVMLVGGPEAVMMSCILAAGKKKEQQERRWGS